MINASEAYNRIREEFPKGAVIAAVDYDEDHYIFSVLSDPNNPPIGSLWYWVDKQYGKVGGFVPMDFIALLDAIEKRSLDLSRLKE